MDNSTLTEQLNKLEKKHKIERWFNLLLGIFCLYLVLYNPSLKFHGEIGFLFVICAGLGGGLIGDSLRNWKGNPELRIAKSALNKLSSQEH